MMMVQALNEFHTIMSNGYADKFNTYRDTIRLSAPGQFDNFVKDGKFRRCFHCANSVPNGDGSFHNETADSSPNEPADVKDEHPSYNTYFLVMDRNVFCSDLLNNYGVDCSWPDWASNMPNLWCFGDDWPNYGNTRGPTYLNWNFNLDDPAAMIQNNLIDYIGLRERPEDSFIEEQYNVFEESAPDPVDSVSISVFTVQEAVSQMSSVVSATQNIQPKQSEDDKKNLLINIASAVLLLLPCIGEIADAAAGIAGFARMAIVLAEAGSLAIAIYDMVDDPAKRSISHCEPLHAAQGRDHRPQHMNWYPIVHKPL